jgi:hypothetical protein
MNMKTKLVLIMAFVIFTSPLQGLELEISGGVGNLFFDRENSEPLGDLGKAFEPALQPIIRTVVSGELGGSVFYSGGFEWDPVLRNWVFANVGINLGLFTMELGPFIGIFNTCEAFLNPGLSVAVGLEFPGVFFARARAFSSIGDVRVEGSYTQRGGILTVGFWVPNVICSLNLETKSFIDQRASDLLLEDNLTRAFFRTDIFAKNNPLNFQLDIGYGILKRIYSQSIDSSDELKYFFLGLEGAYTINPIIKIFLAGEMPLLSWSTAPMKDPGKDKILFQARGGIVLNFQ